MGDTPPPETGFVPLVEPQPTMITRLISYNRWENNDVLRLWGRCGQDEHGAL
jgi:hypothetical protein